DERIVIVPMRSYRIGEPAKRAVGAAQPALALLAEEGVALQKLHVFGESDDIITKERGGGVLWVKVLVGLEERRGGEKPPLTPEFDLAAALDQDIFDRLVR